LAEDVQKRHWHRIRRGKVVAFAVQLEILTEETWLPIVRYDAAHGFAHRDVYETRTRKRKERLELDLADALTLADRNIDRNWRRYVEAFRHRSKR
jgi:hypothetical protein